MKYLRTKHERNSAKLTALISLIILLLLFVVGTKYMDPPEEYGVAVNFGNSSVGKGDVQPLKPVKSEPQEVVEPVEPEVSEPEPEAAAPAEAQEEVLTEDNSEAIAIKKQKEAEAKAKADAEAKAKAEAEAEAKRKVEEAAKEKREQDEKKKKLDALIGGVKKSEGSEVGGEGNDNKSGDKGQLDGDPYATSYFGGQGSGSGGVGYGLNGRGTASFKRLTQDCNESGMVVVRIVVNQSGNVIEATPGVKGTTNTAGCLLDPAKKIALSHKWPADSKAPTRQIGFVSVNFKISE
ncbi:energy transducer TonB [Tamlana sp. 2_MG-2023]|uniref:energy transducer TonB n=1 Tax=unclassified Tamlana TaxID=2614803 RepID=UPI0026E272F4|nr:MULTISPECIES: energy transducer TonB [unclassified Tamlana]MDO6760911.1 energy transducer TonB [Tamlana sp. 2_MG-2023]MDO6791167.1 energy transducer TonB [Tamlana sp. 1_MG-2023]